ncbi:MAG TPA: SPOR domain-containing protein [Asticcacaulis sp.]|nr:SPOR domain-containing protein [Asticcacaulis sp.]
MDKTFAELKAVRVDANDPAPASDADRKIRQKDIDLAVRTAKDLTVNEGGLLHSGQKASGSKVQIAVVDPLLVPRPDNNPPLDERLRGVTFDPAVAENLAAAAHDLPDVPVMPLRLKPLPSTQDGDDSVHRIQVGSFGTLAAAQNAWADLRAHHPAISPLTPSYEKVTTPQGKQLFRLKVGPVTDEAKARDLCDQLAIHDNWCAKAG